MLGVEQQQSQQPPLQIKKELVKEEKPAGVEPPDDSDNSLTIDETSKSGKIPSGRVIRSLPSGNIEYNGIKSEGHVILRYSDLKMQVLLAYQ